jgi:DNA-directed RNA polymerase subunit RPC12/RpoP
MKIKEGENMLNMYTSYKCSKCKLEFILLTEDLSKVSKDRYLVCPYCSSKNISKEKATDDLRQCMKEKSYRRVNGALRQVRHD